MKFKVYISYTIIYVRKRKVKHLYFFLILQKEIEENINQKAMKQVTCEVRSGHKMA